MFHLYIIIGFQVINWIKQLIICTLALFQEISRDTISVNHFYQAIMIIRVGPVSTVLWLNISMVINWEDTIWENLEHSVYQSQCFPHSLWCILCHGTAASPGTLYFICHTEHHRCTVHLPANCGNMKLSWDILQKKDEDNRNIPLVSGGGGRVERCGWSRCRRSRTEGLCDDNDDDDEDVDKPITEMKADS